MKELSIITFLRNFQKEDIQAQQWHAGGRGVSAGPLMPGFIC